MTFKVLFVGEGSVGKTSLLTKYQNPHVAIPTSTNSPSNFWAHQSGPSLVTKEVSVGGIQVKLELTAIRASRGRMSNHHMIIAAAKVADAIVFCFSADNDWTATTLQTFMRLAEQGRRHSSTKQQDLRSALGLVREKGKQIQERLQNVQREIQQLEQFFQQQQQNYIHVQQQLYLYQQHVHQNPWQQLQPQDIEQHKALQNWQVQHQMQEQRYQGFQQEQQQLQQQIQTLTLQHNEILSQITAAQLHPNPVESSLPPILLFQLKTDLKPEATFGDLLAQQTGRKLIKISSSFNYNIDASLEAIATLAIEQKMKSGEISAPAHPVKSLTPTKSKSTKSDVPLVA